MSRCLQRVACLAFAAQLLLCVAFAWGAGALEEGMAAYEKGDYQTAIEKWYALIQEGRADGLFFLGVMYAEGKGVTQDHAKAFQHYSEAAEKNHVGAQYNLGNQYATGQGVAQDFAKAEFWWRKAAEAGLLRAQVNLGNLYYHGMSGEKNLALATKWFTLAADHGSAEAKDMLAKVDAQKPPAVAAPLANADITQRGVLQAARREAWLLAQPAGHYTIQVLATGSEALAEDFIKAQGLAAQAAYVESAAAQPGGAVFRVVYGSYASREQAEKALAALPRAVHGNSPWVRTFADIQKLVDRRRAQRGAPN